MATYALALVEEEPAFAQPTLTTRGWSGAGTREAGRPLSPREREIVTLVNAGKTRKEVAYDLGVTHSTVRVLYSRAMKKLGGRWQPAVGRREVTTGGA
jgi:DNA-binding NarL/FixJ family response regulator